MPPLLGVIISQTKRTSRANFRSYFSRVQFHFSSLVAIIISSILTSEKKQDAKELQKAKSNQLNPRRPKHTAEQTTDVRKCNACVLHIFYFPSIDFYYYLMSSFYCFLPTPADKQPAPSTQCALAVSPSREERTYWGQGEKNMVHWPSMVAWSYEDELEALRLPPAP